MNRLFLLRHGQASFEASQYDRLSPLGADQATETGAWFRDRGIRFDRVISGPRSRQQLSAQLATAELEGGADLEIVPVLNEFAEAENFMRAIAKRVGMERLVGPNVSREEKIRLYSDELRMWTRDEVCIDDVEPVGVFRSRISRWLDEMTRTRGQDQQVLVSTSAGVIAAMVADILAVENRNLEPLIRVIANASLTTIQWSEEERVLESFNQIHHLPYTLLSAI